MITCPQSSGIYRVRTACCFLPSKLWCSRRTAEQQPPWTTTPPQLKNACRGKPSPQSSSPSQPRPYPSDPILTWAYPPSGFPSMAPTLRAQPTTAVSISGVRSEADKRSQNCEASGSSYGGQTGMRREVPELGMERVEVGWGTDGGANQIGQRFGTTLEVPHIQPITKISYTRGFQVLIRSIISSTSPA
jgi:hypothetical protein